MNFQFREKLFNVIQLEINSDFFLFSELSLFLLILSWCIVTDRDNEAAEEIWSMPGKIRAMFLLAKRRLMGEIWRFNGRAMAGASASIEGQEKPLWAFVCVLVCVFWAHLQNQCITRVPAVTLYLDSLGLIPIITGS